MTDKEKIELIKDGVISIFKKFNILDRTATIGGLRDDIIRYINSLQEEPVSDDSVKCTSKIILEGTNFNKSWYAHPELAFKAGAKWQKENLWKPADGDDLPEYEREVVAFQEIFPTDVDVPSLLKIVIAHRPNPEGYDGKSLTTGEVEHYTPETYGKGGWNIPDVKLWLDCSLPNMEEG